VVRDYSKTLMDRYAELVEKSQIFDPVLVNTDAEKMLDLEFGKRMEVKVGQAGLSTARLRLHLTLYSRRSES